MKTCEECPWHELRVIWDGNNHKTELEMCTAEDAVITTEGVQDWCPNGEGK